MGDRGQLPEVSSARILNLQREPARRPDPANRRSIEGENEGFWNFCEFSVSRADQGLYMFTWLALIPVVQWKEHGGGIGTPRIEDEVHAGHRVGRMNGWDRAEIPFDLRENLIGPLLRSAIGQLHDRDEIPLVFFR